MPGKRPKRPRDANVLAKRIVDIATGKAPDIEEPSEAKSATPESQLGRIGGLKGGKARAAAVALAADSARFQYRIALRSVYVYCIPDSLGKDRHNATL
jgi:hypothetical protein